MREIRPGDIIYSSRHRYLLYCFGRNGGRQHEYCGHVIRNGIPDKESWRIFEAGEVEAVLMPEGMRAVLPGTVARTYTLPPPTDLDSPETLTFEPPCPGPADEREQISLFVFVEKDEQGGAS